jgi:hypothetical protein
MHAAFALRLQARPLGPLTFEATSAFTFVTAQWLAVIPRMIRSIGFKDSVVGIEIRRANFRWEVTSLALSIARWVHSSTMAAFPEAPL